MLEDQSIYAHAATENIAGLFLDAQSGVSGHPAPAAGPSTPVDDSKNTPDNLGKTTAGILMKDPKDQEKSGQAAPETVADAVPAQDNRVTDSSAASRLTTTGEILIKEQAGQRKFAPAAPENIAVVSPGASLPTTSAVGVEELGYEPLQKAVIRIHREQFGYWWEGFRRGRQAGDAVRQMWIRYPFGALLLDEIWAWWSMEQVQEDGAWQAGKVGYADGLVVASSAAELAVLAWMYGANAKCSLYRVPRGQESGAQQTALAAMPNRQGDQQSDKEVTTQVAVSGLVAARAPQPMSPDLFLSSTGFADPDRVLACAYVPRRPRAAVSVPLPAAVPGPSLPLVKYPTRSSTVAAPSSKMSAAAQPYARAAYAPGGAARAARVRSDVQRQREIA